jgi:asparagine synthase (glutamine-hydrolysing)
MMYFKHWFSCLYSLNPSLAIAQRTADWLGVNYTKSQMTESDLAENFETAIYHCEHHIHDFNTVGKFCLSRVTRDAGFKVVLTGEGADEQFAGYPLFLPEFLREADYSVNGGKDPLTPEDRKALVAKEEDEVKKSYQTMGGNGSQFVDSASRKELNDLSTPSSMTAFTPTSDVFQSWAQKLASNNLVTTISENITPLVKEQIRDKWHALHGALYTWSKGHLANQLLTCLGDRVEMAHSIEARTPFLDHHMTAYANTLPPSTKLRWVPNGQVNGQSEKGRNGVDGAWVEKWIMREAVKEFVTPELYGRRKHAYAAPSSYPKDGPIQRLLVRLVNQENVEELGFLNWKAIQGYLELAFPSIDPSGEEKREVLEKRVWSWRVLIIVASWVVIHQKFELKTAKAL